MVFPADNRSWIREMSLCRASNCHANSSGRIGCRRYQQTNESGAMESTTAVMIFESNSCSSVPLWPAGRCPCYVAQSQKPTPAYAVIQGFICKGSSYSMQTTCQAQEDEAIPISFSAMCRPRYLARLSASSYLRKEAGKYGRHNAAAARHSVQRVTVSATRFRSPQETTGLSVVRNACG